MLLIPVSLYSITAFFINSNYSKVGTSCKRNQSFEMKQKKKETKQQKTSNTNAVCSSYKEVGHSSSLSPLCKNHLSSKLEVFNNNLGKAYQLFTRKLPFRSCICNDKSNIAATSSSVNPQSAATIKSRTISACEDVRQLIFRA